jgi:uncharacterized protein (TIGR00369 family)
LIAGIRNFVILFICNLDKLAVIHPNGKRVSPDRCHGYGSVGSASTVRAEPPARESERMPTKTYGTVSAEQRKQMSGLEFVQGLADGTLPMNTIAKTLGYDIAEATVGRVVVTADPDDTLLNPAGTVHGGFSATLLDSCMGLALQTTLEKGLASTTLEFKISLLRPITPRTGPIRAEGVVLQRGRRVGTAEGRITDASGKLLAHGTTTCLVFEG